jgi:hypothetical protein
MRLLLCVVVCLALVACHKTNSYQKLSPEAAAQARLDWNLKTTVEAYNRIGGSYAAWDGFATNALIEFAQPEAAPSRTGAFSGQQDWAIIIRTNCAAAVQAGCDDPMIRYLYIRFCMDQTHSAEDFSREFCRVARDMQKSAYPEIRKFYASAHALDQLFYAYGTNVDLNTVNELANNIESTLTQIAADKSTPPEEAYEACSLGLHEVSRSKSEYENLYHKIEQPLFQNWPEESTCWLLKGEAYITFAWQARGSGYANTVTEEGGKTFTSDLAVAENALNRAWNLNPTDPRIPLQMMTVVLGQGKDRDEMESWFERAMALNPSDYDICSKKLYYLEPKWYGSAGDMLDFGRECVQNTNWGGRVPLILVDAHYNICNEYTDEADRTNYWQQPDVWADIKSAYKRFFQLHPDDTSSIPYYAWYAYHAEDWDKLNELIPKLSPANYAFFGGKDGYDKMIQLAKEHASPPAAAPSQ